MICSSGKNSAKNGAKNSAKNGAKNGAFVIVVVVAAATLAICAFASPVVDASATGTTSKSYRNVLPYPIGSTSPLRLRSKRRAEEEAANDNYDGYNYDGYNYDGYNYEEVEEEEAYLGYVTPKECVAYTISMGEDQYKTERNMGISVVGLESFMFFEYVIPYDDANEEAEYENENDDARNEDQDENDGNNQRNLEENGENNQENYGGENIYFGQNVITAKQWLTAFENDGSSYGCTPMIDPTGVFQNYVQGLNDGKLSFSNLYYGPVCSNDSTSSNSTAFFEMGVFLDSFCTAYVPGLSQILSEKIISEWTTGVSVRENSGSSTSSSTSSYYSTNTLYNYDGDFVNDCWSSDYKCDLKTLDSTQSTIHQFNYYHNRDDTDCQTYPEICLLVFRASVDLDTCQFLDYELSGEEEGENNNYANDDQAIQESANDYGEFVEVVSSEMKYGDDNEEDEEEVVEEAYYYQMFQEVIVDYLEFTIDTWYGGGDNGDNEDAENAYNEESNAGICYGLLASASEGYSLGEWMDDNSRQLSYELDRIYQLDNPSYALWYGVGTLVAFCALVLFFVIACGFRNDEITDPAMTNPSGSEIPPPVVPLKASGGSKSDALLGGPPPNRKRSNPVNRIRDSVEVLLNQKQNDGDGIKAIDKGAMC